MDTNIVRRSLPEVTDSQDERPCACYSGWVFVGYEDEHGEEREASYRCRRCAGEGTTSPNFPLDCNLLRTEESMDEFARIVEEIEQLRPADVARAKSLLRRSDSLESAIVCVGDASDDGDINDEAAEETIEVLEVMLEEINAEFERARRELGIPGPRD